MTSLDKINFFVSSYGRTFVALFKVRLWPPFLIYFLILVLVIVAIQSMFSPLLAVWLIPLVKAAAGSDSVLHYPQHLLLLPNVFERFRFIAISWIVESALMSAAYLMFAAYYTRQKLGFVSALREAMKRYHLVAIALIVNTALVYVLFLTLPDLFADFTHGAPRRMVALGLGFQALSLLLSSLFVYVVPLLVIAKQPLGRSFIGSFRLFFRNFFTTYFLVLIPNILLILLSVVLQLYTQDIVSKFHPRVMVMLTYLNAVLSIAANFFIVSTVTRFFLEFTEE